MTSRHLEINIINHISYRAEGPGCRYAGNRAASAFSSVVPDGYSVNSVSSVFKKRLGPLPSPPRGKAPPQPSPGGRERLARWSPSPTLPGGGGGWLARWSPSPTLPGGGGGWLARCGFSPTLTVGAGEAGAMGARRVGEFRSLVMWVCMFRVISCRDAALASSKCAGWFSVKSVSSVFKTN